jgi:hypothetical protein
VPVPANAQKAITDLITILQALQSDAMAASLKSLDSSLAPLRAKDPAYIPAITADLTNYLKGLKDDTSKTTAFKNAGDLSAALAALQAPPVAITKLADDLITDLGKTLSDADKAKIKAKLAELQTKLQPFIAGNKIHIISAQYGDIRGQNPERRCIATAYFIGQCEGQANCPAIVSKDVPTPPVLNGATVCGYEPAPLASDGTNFARVFYMCVNVGADGTRQPGGTGVKYTELHKNDRIVCSP